jgi:hypothetical protein
MSKDMLLERAKKWVEHFEANGIHNTVWHDIVKRHEAKPAKKPKQEKELKHGSQDIS